MSFSHSLTVFLWVYFHRVHFKTIKIGYSNRVSFIVVYFHCIHSIFISNFIVGNFILFSRFFLFFCPFSRSACLGEQSEKWNLHVHKEWACKRSLITFSATIIFNAHWVRKRGKKPLARGLANRNNQINTLQQPSVHSFTVFFRSLVASTLLYISWKMRARAPMKCSFFPPFTFFMVIIYCVEQVLNGIHDLFIYLFLSLSFSSSSLMSSFFSAFFSFARCH